MFYFIKSFIFLFPEISYYDKYDNMMKEYFSLEMRYKELAEMSKIEKQKIDFNSQTLNQLNKQLEWWQK